MAGTCSNRAINGARDTNGGTVPPFPFTSASSAHCTFLASHARCRNPKDVQFFLHSSDIGRFVLSGFPPASVLSSPVLSGFVRKRTKKSWFSWGFPDLFPQSQRAAEAAAARRPQQKDLSAEHAVAALTLPKKIFSARVVSCRFSARLSLRRRAQQHTCCLSFFPFFSPSPRSSVRNFPWTF